MAFALVVFMFAPGCGGSGSGAAEPTRPPAVSQDDSSETTLEDEDISAFDGDWRTKDYAGTVLKWLDAERYMFIANPINWSHSMYMAILEWQVMTGATIELLPALEIVAVLAGITAGEGYDLIPNGAYYSMNDHLMYLDDHYDYFSNKYGTKYTSQVGSCIYNGHFIGMSWPWGFGGAGFLYNAELLDRLGLERPSQLFMRGEWTWDSYWDLICYVGQIDIDGDGEKDYVAGNTNNQHFNYMVQLLSEKEDGTYEIVCDNQRLRDYADMIYNGFNILEVYTEDQASPWQFYAHSNERQIWAQSMGSPALDPTCIFGFVDNNGDMLEWAPMPAYGDGQDSNPVGGSGLAILKGAQNPDAAIHFIDFAFNAVGYTAITMVNRGRGDFPYQPLMTGRTKESAEYLEWWANFIEKDYERFENGPYFSWEYYDAVIEYWNNLPVRGGATHGWRSSYFYTPTHQVMKDYPPSTAVSMFLEELKAMVDEHNEFIASRQAG